jgi:fucose permease
MALFGFSVSTAYWQLLLWSVPYGLGAGSVDASLNNYVAIHYSSRCMSWLHCMWGIGASISPYIMSFSLVRLENWNMGYLIVSIIQVLFSAVIFISLPLWHKGNADNAAQAHEASSKALSFKEVFYIKGAIPSFMIFLSYCALELTTSFWASTYLVQKWEFAPEIAAGFASMFYIGITFGRFINGFLAMKLNDRFLIRAGSIIVAVGISLLFLPFHSALALIGFIIIGLGCAPIYPCIIHMTPDVFGKDKSQAMIGVQMAFAYTGFLIMPSLFGVIAENISISLLPVYQLVLLCVMAIMHERVLRKNREN